MTATVDGSMSAPDRDELVRGGESVDALRQLGRILTGSRPGPGTDWASIADLARYQGMSAFLCWRLAQRESDNGADSVPQEVVEELQADFYSAAAHGMRAEQQLATVLGALSAAEVPAVVVKGAALGAYYPDQALRPYSDIDIMVLDAQLDVAEEALSSLGYKRFASEGWWLDHLHHLPPMVSEGEGLRVELHWGLDYQEGAGRLPADDLWARAVPWTVHGEPALRLDEVDAALHLCRHAVVQHRVYGAFRYLCDLAQLTEGWGQGEWEVLGRRALDYGLARPVYLMLVLAEQALNLTIPMEVVSILSPSGGVQEPEELTRRLLGADADTSVRVSLGAVQAVMEGSFAARLQRVVGRLLLPREGMAMVYKIPADSPRIWLTYLWRPIDLSRRYGRSVWRVLRGERGAQVVWQREVWLEHWLKGDEPMDEQQGEWLGKA